MMWPEKICVTATTETEEPPEPQDGNKNMGHALTCEGKIGKRNLRMRIDKYMKTGGALPMRTNWNIIGEQG